MKKIIFLIAIFCVQLFIFGEPYKYIPDNGSDIYNGKSFPIAEITKLIIGSKEYAIDTPYKDIGLKKNTELKEPFFIVKYVPAKDAYEDETVIVGWHTNDRVSFISSDDKNAQTGFGVKIGDSKEKVLKMYGEPTWGTENTFQYSNYSYEIVCDVGTVLHFKNDKVVRISCYLSCL